MENSCMYVDRANINTADPGNPNLASDLASMLDMEVENRPGFSIRRGGGRERGRDVTIGVGTVRFFACRGKVTLGLGRSNAHYCLCSGLLSVGADVNLLAVAVGRDASSFSYSNGSVDGLFVGVLDNGPSEAGSAIVIDSFCRLNFHAPGCDPVNILGYGMEVNAGFMNHINVDGEDPYTYLNGSSGGLNLGETPQGWNFEGAVTDLMGTWVRNATR